MTDMEKMLPVEIAEPVVRGGAGGVALRGTLYALLGLAVIGGAWVRFNTPIAAVVPGLAAAGNAAASQAGRARGLIELGLVPAGEAEAAVGGMGLSGNEATLMQAALRDRRLRLVRMPLVDVTVAATGHDVTVSTAGYSRVVRLTRTPVVLTLPVGAGAEVSFATPDTDAVGIGALAMSGPVRLPDIVRGDVMGFAVVAQ